MHYVCVHCVCGKEPGYEAMCVCVWGGAWVRGYVCVVLFIHVWVEGVTLNLNLEINL